MSKSPAKSIGLEEIISYTDQDADFEFELNVLEFLKKRGLRCLHSGTFRDPVTDKFRQFDIRALQSSGFLKIHWAIECKNIREENPLIARLVRRDSSDAFNDVTVGEGIEIQSPRHAALTYQSPPGDRGRIVRLSDTATLYQRGEWVAKSVDQIAKDGQGKWKPNDSQFFEKSSQALSSAFDLIEDSFHPTNETNVSFVIPVLVIPDQRLWAVEYCGQGKRLEPKAVSWVQSFVHWEWKVKTAIFNKPAPFTISHLEIVEISRLQSLLDRFSKLFVTIFWETALNGEAWKASRQLRELSNRTMPDIAK